MIFSVILLAGLAGALVTWALTSRHYLGKIDYLYARNRALMIRANREN